MAKHDRHARQRPSHDGSAVHLVVAIERDAAGFARAVERMNLEREAIVKGAHGRRRQGCAGGDEMRERDGPAVGGRIRQEVLKHERHTWEDARAKPLRIAAQQRRDEQVAQDDGRSLHQQRHDQNAEAVRV